MMVLQLQNIGRKAVIELSQLDWNSIFLLFCTMVQIAEKNEASWGEIISDIVSYAIIIPFIPIAFGLIWFFGWVIGKGREVSKD